MGGNFRAHAQLLGGLAIEESHRAVPILAGVGSRSAARQRRLDDAQEGLELPAALVEVVALPLIRVVPARELEVLDIELEPNLDGEAGAVRDGLRVADAHEKEVEEGPKASHLARDDVEVLDVDPRETLGMESGPHPVQYAVGSVHVINAHELARQERLAETVALAVVAGEPVLVERLLWLARAVGDEAPREVVGELYLAVRNLGKNRIAGSLVTPRAQQHTQDEVAARLEGRRQDLAPPFV